MKKYIQNLKSKIYKKLNLCEHSYNVHPDYETVFHYGSIGQVLAFDQYSICSKCKQEIVVRNFTNSYNLDIKKIIKNGNLRQCV